MKNIILALSLLICLLGCSQQKELPPPNILWISCEDISPQLGCYDDPYAHTPNLDKLAQEGVVYTRAFASAPVCAVARSSIITGMYSSSYGSQHMRCNGWLPKDVKTYPDYLRSAGYYCTNNSKTDYNLNIDHKAMWDESSGNAHWRNRPNPDQPFFAIFNLGSTHESRVNVLETHQKAIENVPASLLKKPGDIPVPPYFPNTEKVQELWTRYYNNITAMDLQVAEILQQLEEDGLSDNTIIIFFSDHGAGVPRYKRWLYDTGLHVPFIVKVPEKYKEWFPHAADTKTDELVSFIDLPPTTLALAGIPIPENMEGRAFLGEDLSPQRKYVYAGRDRMDERYDMQRAVRNKRFKYIRYYESYKPFCQYMNTPEKGEIMKSIRAAQLAGNMPKAGRHIIAPQKPEEELFDTQNDPLEIKNLVNDPEYKNVLEEMRQAHAQWSDRTKDTGLIPETILRTWERQDSASIYDIMRKKSIPVTLIRETALGQKNIEELIQSLGHENDAVRYWAAIHLGNRAKQISDGQALEKALQDLTPVVQTAAARALCKMNKPQKALECLQKLLHHEDEWVRLNAAQVLDEIGPQARPAIEALQSVMEDKNKYVVRVANHALNAMLGTENIVR